MLKAGITEKMNVEEHEEKEQAETATDPRFQMFGHWNESSIALGFLSVNAAARGNHAESRGFFPARKTSP
jgi:hypothetical protein